MTSPNNPGSGWDAFNVARLRPRNYYIYWRDISGKQWFHALALKVCAPASCDGRAGEGERSMGLRGGRHGRSVPGHRQLCSGPWCGHFHRKGYFGRLFCFLHLILQFNWNKKKINLFPWQEVEQILVGSDGAARGVVLKEGTEIHSKVVLSNATPYVTFSKLTPQVLQRNRKHHAALPQISFNI